MKHTIINVLYKTEDG